MKIRRINFYAGPGCGKSKISPSILSTLKKTIIQDNLDIYIELVQEYVKSWALQGIKPKGFDQVYICAKQMRREERPLRSGIDLIVTDSPLLLQCFYAIKNKVPGWCSLIDLVEAFEEEYPGLHIFLDRQDQPYTQKGRYENLEEAKEMDAFILDKLHKHMNNNFHIMNYNDENKIIELIKKEIEI
ncbi:MAG: AAA family ATPase [Nitrososphaeraceae archaeon]